MTSTTSEATSTVTTTETSPDDAGFTWDGILQTWVVDAPADKVGPNLQFDKLLQLDPVPAAFTSATATGGGVGATRTVVMPDGGPTLVEQCIAADPRGHQYLLVEGSEAFNIAPSSYRGSFAVAPATDTTSTITWTCSYLTSAPTVTKAALQGFVPLMEAAWTTLAAALSEKARPIRDEATELTPAWLTMALKERGNLPAGVEVSSFEHLNLGEGRGYAGKTLKIYNVKYTGPTELPSVFVMKIPNYMMETIDWGKTIFSMCDLGFRQENQFYARMHAKHPIPLPKMYWIGEEPNSSPSSTMPRASILMEIVDDPAMISQIDGCTEADGREFLTALAKIQAVHWESAELDGADWLMSSETIGAFKHGVVAEALPRLRGIKEFMAVEFAEDFLSMLERSLPKIETFNAEASAHGKTLCHGDARTENCLWPNQRSEGIVIIDWQFISFANPMTDLCYFIGTCFTKEEQDKYSDALIQHYWNELTSSPGGPSAEEYPFATMLDDYKKCMWVSMWITAMGVANLQCIKDEAKKHEGTPAAEAYNGLVETMIPLLFSFLERHYNAAKHVGAESVL